MTHSAIPRVHQLLSDWQTARAKLAELERLEHPDIVDVNGRIWTWWKGTLYRTPRPDIYPPTPERPEGGKAAWPRHFIPTAEESP
jgi:hypothetical protein